MQNKLVISIEKLDKISRKKWLSQFPSQFPNEIWNGHWEREEKLLLDSLKRAEKEFPHELKEAIRKSNCKKYICSQNKHNKLWGLNDKTTPEEGGIIAQASSKKGCLEKASKIYGINLIFISF